MGVYETYTKGKETIDRATGIRTWTEHQRWPGYINSRTVTATPWVETSRTDCFCCSCGDREGSDSSCRNHNYGFDRRPCEVHHLPGQADDDGKMPESVQVERARRDAVEARYRR